MGLERDEKVFTRSKGLRKPFGINSLRWDKCPGQIILFVPGEV